ncbi:MAG TPA: hypothetical protein VFA65_10910 [Bryobacteraceae bacterium]|nr:hypothetical protein [Bryobacteraceae bacterium]
MILQLLIYRLQWLRDGWVGLSKGVGTYKGGQKDLSNKIGDSHFIPFSPSTYYYY